MYTSVNTFVRISLLDPASTYKDRSKWH